jgi:hypothetical protein
MSSDNEDISPKENQFDLIVRNLKIISSIKPNDKIIKKGNTIKIDTPYIYQGISRYWNGDSRKESLNQIEHLIENTFNRIDLIYSNEIEHRTGGLNGSNNYYNKGHSYFETENTQKLQIFSNELKNSIGGLNSLKQTYNVDISICSRIEVVIEKINLRIKKIQELFKINITNEHDNKSIVHNNKNNDNNNDYCFTDDESE